LEFPSRFPCFDVFPPFPPTDELECGAVGVMELSSWMMLGCVWEVGRRSAYAVFKEPPWWSVRYIFLMFSGNRRELFGWKKACLAGRLLGSRFKFRIRFRFCLDIRFFVFVVGCRFVVIGGWIFLLPGRFDNSTALWLFRF